MLLVELEGLTEEVADLGLEAETILSRAGASEVRWAESAEERDRLWSARKSALGALGSLAPNYYLVDGVVPRTRLAEVLRRVSEISSHYGMPIANVFHAGDGNIHPCILFDERKPGDVERVMEVGGEILKACVEMGGTLSGEHGIGLEKKAYMPLVFSGEDMDVMQRVRDAFAPKGRFNPGKAKGALGGNVAENAGGPHCLAYGVTSNHVLGMEVVLEDGSVTWLGGNVRDPSGYDLRGVFVGSEGTFGLATKIIVRLLPLPPVTKTYLAVFADLESACDAVSSIIARGMVPAALEMIDALTIKAVQNVTQAGLPDDAGAVLLVELEGLTEEVADLGLEAETILSRAGASEVRWAESAEERDRLWSARKSALGALGSLAPNYYLVDGVVPRTRLAEVLRRVSEISSHYGMPIANVFHAGDGNIHPCILFDAPHHQSSSKRYSGRAAGRCRCSAPGGVGRANGGGSRPWFGG